MQDNTYSILTLTIRNKHAERESGNSNGEVPDEKEETLLSLKSDVTLNTLNLVQLNSNQTSGW